MKNLLNSLIKDHIYPILVEKGHGVHLYNVLQKVCMSHHELTAFAAYHLQTVLYCYHK